MSDEKIIVMTGAQLKEFAKEIASQLLGDAKKEKEYRQIGKDEPYVYGIRGIRDLFKVSHSTAQMYKNTFLAPAVMQRGKKLIVDVKLAMELYNQRTNL